MKPLDFYDNPPAFIPVFDSPRAAGLPEGCSDATRIAWGWLMFRADAKTLAVPNVSARRLSREQLGPIAKWSKALKTLESCGRILRSGRTVTLVRLSRNQDKRETVLIPRQSGQSDAIPRQTAEELVMRNRDTIDAKPRQKTSRFRDKQPDALDKERTRKKKKQLSRAPTRRNESASSDQRSTNRRLLAADFRLIETQAKGAVIDNPEAWVASTARRMSEDEIDAAMDRNAAAGEADARKAAKVDAKADRLREDAAEKDGWLAAFDDLPTDEYASARAAVEDRISPRLRSLGRSSPIMREPYEQAVKREKIAHMRRKQSTLTNGSQR